jgi:sialidase-1
MRTIKLSAVAWVLVAVLAAPSCKKSDVTQPKDLASNDVKNEKLASLSTSDPTYTKIFDGGAGGYHSYRIPSIIKSTAGTLITFCEGRVSNNKDYGNIDIVFKRSLDDGATWTTLGVVAGSGTGTLANGTFGNPTAVVDQSNGKIWLFMSWNDFGKNQNGDDGKTKIAAGDRPVYVCSSTNDGVTWSAPANITSSVQPAGMAWDAMGPGIGIQTSISNSGRLIIPAIGRNIYSDNHGSSWTYAAVPGGTSESTIVELSNGSLLRNDRAVLSNWEIAKRRWLSKGTSITSFAAFAPKDELLDPRCEGSMLRYTMSEPKRILFLNSASTVTRLKMRIRISYDEGNTWPISREVYDGLTETQQHDQGKGGYSSLVKTADLKIGALIENNEDVVNTSTAHLSVEFAKFGLSWVLNGTTEP